MNQIVSDLVLADLIANGIIKLTCFLLGYQTIRLGYKLINDGVKGEFKFSANYSGLKGGLVSSSPGLLFLLLGIILIGYAMGVTKAIDLDYHAPQQLQQTKEKKLPHDTPSNDTI